MLNASQSREVAIAVLLGMAGLYALSVAAPFVLANLPIVTPVVTIAVAGILFGAIRDRARHQPKDARVSRPDSADSAQY